MRNNKVLLQIVFQNYPDTFIYFSLNSASKWKGILYLMQIKKGEGNKAWMCWIAWKALSLTLLQLIEDKSKMLTKVGCSYAGSNMKEECEIKL